MKLIPEVFSTSGKVCRTIRDAWIFNQLVLETDHRRCGSMGINMSIFEGEKVSPFILLSGLCIHAFLEGMPIVKAFDSDIRQSLVIGIIIHNIPISIALMSLLLHYGVLKQEGIHVTSLFLLL